MTSIDTLFAVFWVALAVVAVVVTVSITAGVQKNVNCHLALPNEFWEWVD